MTSDKLGSRKQVAPMCTGECSYLYAALNEECFPFLCNPLGVRETRPHLNTSAVSPSVGAPSRLPSIRNPSWVTPPQPQRWVW